MRPAANPLRLSESSGLGPLMKSAASRRFAPARLTRNGAAIESKIEALTAAGSTASAAGAALGAGKVAKILLPFVVAAAGVAVWQQTRRERASAPEPPVRVEQPAVTPSEEEAPVPPVIVRPMPQKARRPLEPSKEVVASELPEQLRIFEAARTAAAGGDYDGALARLDELAERFPKSSLRAEALLSRVECLSRAGRDEAAIELVQSMLHDPALLGKKAQLLRLTGDSWRRRGECGRAVAAYQQALGLGLAAAEAEAARAGLQSCRR